jgi:hypothetical protein
MIPLQTPVAFFVFNRPALTARVFERIRQARPEKLFVVCDGPRDDRPEEKALVEAVRDIVAGVDWNCEVHRDYAERNLGCDPRVESGLNAVFKRFEEAIILEDDCLPDPSFFEFCQDLLQRYRTEERVMHIGGCNLAAPFMRAEDSYWFSRHPWTWGWASWRRAWTHYRPCIHSNAEEIQSVVTTFASRWEAQFWMARWNETKVSMGGGITWDFTWQATVRWLNGLAILPRCNLIENLGLDGGGTHNFDPAIRSRLAISAEAINIANHPMHLKSSRFRDELLTRVYSGDRLGILDDMRSFARTNLTCNFRAGPD